MLAVLLIGLLLAGVAAGLFARALLVPRLRAAETIGSIEAYGYSGRLRSRTRQRPNLLSRLDALAGAVGASLSARVHGFSEQQLRRQLRSNLVTVIGVDGYDHLPTLLEQYRRLMTEDGE